MAAEPQIVAQVNDRASAVTGQLDKSLAGLTIKFLGGDSAAAAKGVLLGLKPQIDGWAKRGRDAAKAGKPPLASNGTASTWARWIAQGDNFLSGINDITHEGLNAHLDLIRESVASVPADTVRVVKKVATTAAAVAKEAADVTGSVAGSLIRPLLLPLGIVAAVVAFVFIKTRGV